MLRMLFSNIKIFVKRYIFTPYTAFCVIGLWFIFACIWTITYKNEEWISDSGLYQYFATICYNHHTMYPDESFVHNECIINPGWINMLILWKHLFNDFSGVPYMLLLLNAINLFLLWVICKTLSNRKALRYIVLYTCVLIPAFATNTIDLLTEVPYISFSLCAFYLCTRHELWPSIVAGILVAVSLWIRPVAEAWILAGIFMLIVTHRYVNLLFYILAVIISCTTIAVCTHVNFPDYVYKATSGGANLLIGANDSAEGCYTFAPRGEGGAGYLPGLRTDIDMPVKSANPNNPNRYIKECSELYRYDEVDKHYKSKAIEWIISHPFKWISLFPSKIKHLLFSGTLQVYPLSNKNCHFSELINWMYGWQRHFVTFIMVVSIIGLFFSKSWKDIHRIYVVIPIVIASAMTCMCFGAPRFNFVFLPLVIIYYAYTLLTIEDYIIRKATIKTC